jgi:hypothetical protein
MRSLSFQQTSTGKIVKWDIFTPNQLTIFRIFQRHSGWLRALWKTAMDWIREKLNSFSQEWANANIDYRCDNRRFWLSAHNCQVPNPTSQNLATRTANSDFWSRLTHQLLGRLKFTIPNLQIYLPKQTNLGSWGWEWQSVQDSFFFSSLRLNKCFARVNRQHFWNPEVFSYALIPRRRPNSRFFFFLIVTSTVYEFKYCKT